MLFFRILWTSLKQWISLVHILLNKDVSKPWVNAIGLVLQYVSVVCIEVWFFSLKFEILQILDGLAYLQPLRYEYCISGWLRSIAASRFPCMTCVSIYSAEEHSMYNCFVYNKYKSNLCFS